MRRKLVAANWKMHGLKPRVDALLDALVPALDGERACDVVICPPSLYIEQARLKLAGSGIALGAQNVFIHDEGAYTGEISAAMLADCGCGHVIVGHSERRAIFGESDELIAEKFAHAQSHGLTPILCVGETFEQRKAGRTVAVVLAQIRAVLERNGVAGFANAVVAYEPVWAIGTGLSASPEQAAQVHALIRREIAGRNENVAQSLPIVYGGSVKAGNAGELFAQPEIDGGLVGGASLVAEEFIAICSAANKV